MLGRCLPTSSCHPNYNQCRPCYSFGRRLWPRLRVLGRCLPSDKHLLVTALQRLRQQGEGGGGGGQWQKRKQRLPWGAPETLQGTPELEFMQQEIVAMTGNIMRVSRVARGLAAVWALNTACDLFLFIYCHQCEASVQNYIVNVLFPLRVTDILQMRNGGTNMLHRPPLTSLPASTTSTTPRS